jgi:hypothetical protein
MKYLCLGYRRDDAWDAMSDPDRAAVRTVRTAAAVQFRNGQPAIAECSAAPEPHDQLANVQTLEAEDLNHLIALLSRLDWARASERVEIRPVEGNVQPET